MPKQPRTASPEAVSAMLRSTDTGPDAPYPCQIGVNCDECGTVVTGDYIVNDRMTKPERLEVARTNLRAGGWSCTAAGDFCPACAVFSCPADIHTYMGLSYASYLVFPRTLLQSMPEEWQQQFVALLEAADDAFEHVPQAEAYEVTAGRYEEDGDDYVFVPGPDPVPHYNRGRTHIEPHGGVDKRIRHLLLAAEQAVPVDEERLAAGAGEKKFLARLAADFAKDIEAEADTSVESLRVDLAQLHLGAVSSRTSKDASPETTAWRMTAATTTALASHLLEAVRQSDPGKAAELAIWFAGQFGDGPDLEDHTEWLEQCIAGSPAVYAEWLKEAATEAQQATAPLGTESR